MGLKEYGLEILFSSLGISDIYRSYIQGQDAKLELIAQYLKGDLLEKTNQAPLSPQVNILIEEIEKDLFKKLPSDLPYVKKWYWPDWKDYALFMTHDTDKISESRKHIWKIRKRFSKMTVFKALLGVSNPYNNLKLFIKLEKQYGVRSTFYFLANEYNFDKIKQEIQLLKENHMDLGLHGGFGTYNDFIKLNNEKEKLEQILEQKISGTRQHFLEFEFPTTWTIQNQAKLLYDSTVSFNDKIGFKIGFAFPFFPPDNNLNPLSLIELPLIIMDAAIWTWLQLTEESAIVTIQQIRDIIKEYHGLLTILWHQCVLKMQGGRIYQKVLESLVEDSVYMATGAEIAQWWHARNDFQIFITPKENEIIVQLKNPRSIKNLGILIKIKKKIELISNSSNLKLLEKTNSYYKFTFLEGDSGEIKFKNI